MVAILTAGLTDGLTAVEAACTQALPEGVHSSGVILNILTRRRAPGPGPALAGVAEGRQARVYQA